MVYYLPSAMSFSCRGGNWGCTHAARCDTLLWHLQNIDPNVDCSSKTKASVNEPLKVSANNTLYKTNRRCHFDIIIDFSYIDGIAMNVYSVLDIDFY